MGSLKGCLGILSSFIVLSLAISHGAVIKECNTYLDNHLLVAEDGKISRLNLLNPSEKETVVSSPAVTSFDYSYAKNTLYYTDLATRQVYALKDKSTEAEIVVEQQAWIPTGVAVDDVTDKLYIADGVTGTVNVFDFKTKNLGIVLGLSVTQPSRIVLDIEEGYLFVLDKFQILRTDLDGSNPQVIHSKPPVFINSLMENIPVSVGVSDIVLNKEEKRIYWVDYTNRDIESANYDGQDKKVHFRDQNQNVITSDISSLALFEGKLYWADDGTQKVYKIDVNGNNDAEVLLDGEEPLALKAISCSSYKPKSNPCSNDNGQCQHFCLISSSGSKCACNIGYELAKDGKSCERVEDFVLFAQGEFIKGLNINAKDKISADVVNPTQFDVGSGALIEYDAKDGAVFTTSNFPKDQLHQVNLVSGDHKELSPNFLSTKTGFISYDWVSKNLYYMSYYYADVSILSVLNVRNPTYSKVVVKDVPRLVRGIAVHPNSGHVYFARLDDNKPVKSTISRVNTDGSELKILINLDENTAIDTVAVDNFENRVYWSESQNNANRWEARIRHSNLDGTDIQELTLPSHIFGVSSISFDQDHIFITVNGRRLVRLDRKNGISDELIESAELDSLMEAKFFSRQVQTPKADHPCSEHDCQKFCFAVPEGNSESLKRVCGCPYGEKISEDGKTCVDNSKEEPPFVPCKITSFRCNMQVAPVA